MAHLQWLPCGNLRVYYDKSSIRVKSSNEMGHGFNSCVDCRRVFYIILHSILSPVALLWAIGIPHFDAHPLDCGKHWKTAGFILEFPAQTPEPFVDSNPTADMAVPIGNTRNSNDHRHVIIMCLYTYKIIQVCHVHIHVYIYIYIYTYIHMYIMICNTVIHLLVHMLYSVYTFPLHWKPSPSPNLLR